MSDITDFINYKRGNAINKERTSFYWYLYIGGLCVGEFTGTAMAMFDRLMEIHQEVREKTAAAEAE